jgi:TetR/AcrR family transcriptional repressor of nem operon
MPWPKHHKERTRERIVESAAAAFRARGIDAVQLGEIMAQAGLTHGGFYAHFRSKDELVEEALTAASRQTRDRFSKALDAAEPAGRLHGLVDAYLSAAHVEHPEVGCPVAALAPELARGSGATKRALAREVQQRITWMQGLASPGHTKRTPRHDDQIIGALAGMVGGVILARAVGGGKAGQAVIESTRAFLHGALSSPPPRKQPRRHRPRT